MKKPKFHIGQEVYHITPESDTGVVIEINYSYAFNINTYTVATAFGVQHECAEHELSDSKIF